MQWQHLSLETPEAAEVAEPITLSAVKRHLAQTLDTDDEYIVGLIAAARDFVESFTHRALVARTATMVMPSFPKWGIRLPFGKAQSVTKIDYVDTAGTLTTLTFTDSPTPFQVELTSEDYGVVTPLADSVWPSTDYQAMNAVTVTWEAGYGDPSDVPHVIRHAMALQVAEWYEARSSLEGAGTSELFNRTVGPYVVRY